MIAENAALPVPDIEELHSAVIHEQVVLHEAFAPAG